MNRTIAGDVLVQHLTHDVLTIDAGLLARMAAAAAAAAAGARW